MFNILTRFLTALLVGSTALQAAGQSLQYLEVCKQIKAAISSASGVHYPGELVLSTYYWNAHSPPNKKGSFLYAKDVSHWASSSSEHSACSVEPGTSEDVSKIDLQTFGDSSGQIIRDVTLELRTAVESFVSYGG